MRCRTAKSAITEPGCPSTPALQRHLAGCPSCSADLRVEAWLRQAAADLARQARPEIDVRERVMRQLVELGPVSRFDVPTWQLGWATAATCGAVLVLGAILPWWWPGMRQAAEQVAALLAGLGQAVSTLTAPALALLAVPLRLVGPLTTAAREALISASRVEPVAIAAVAVAYAVMAVTVVRVVGRDLRAPRTDRGALRNA